MGVDLCTYRARIGTLVNFGMPKFVRNDIVVSKSRQFRISSAIFFLSLLLLCGDVESNLGPSRKRCAACGIYQDSSHSYFQFPDDDRSVWCTS